jgi:hypothetical protein
VTETVQEFVKPYADRLTKVQWIATSVVIGFFFGFVDTLMFACLLGYFGLLLPSYFGQLPAYFGVPTTFSGYFVSGYLLSRFAPKEIVWEIPSGILICSLLFMFGFVGFSGQGALHLLFHYVVLPAVAVGVCYLGLVVGREGWAGVRSLVQRRRKDGSTSLDI